MDASFYSPDGVGGSVRAAIICMIVFTSIVVPCRFLSRYLAKRAGYWWDDWLILGAWILLLVFDGLTLGMVANGFGAHMGTVTRPQILRLQLYLYIGQQFYNLGLTLLKLSVLFFYVRVFTLRKLWFKISVWMLGSICVAWVFGISFMAAFKCRPVQKAFIPFLAGNCIDYNTTVYATAISNTIIDVFILIIPVPHLWQLQVSNARRISLIVVFLLGYVVLGLSIGRLVVGIQAGQSKSGDSTYDTASTGLLTVLEGGIGVISVCVPALLQLFVRLQKMILDVPWLSNISSGLSLRGKTGAHLGPVGNPIDPDYRDRKQYDNIALSDVSGTRSHSAEAV